MSRMNTCRRDEGAALILALVMITVISLGLLSLASLTQTNLQSTNAVATAETNSTSTESAIDQVITQLRNDATQGVDPTGSGGNCQNVASYSIASGMYGNAPPITVTCYAEAGSGATGGGGGTPLNVPDVALLASGQSSSETGLAMTGNGTLKVDGPVYSNSPRTAAQGGSISASTNAALSTGTYAINTVGQCNGPAANYTPACTTGQPAKADASWPAPAAPTNVVGNSSISGACGVANPLSPGIYTDASALNSLISGCNNVIWFQPGVYYFDFSNGGSHTLAIANPNAHVVGGQLSSTPSLPGSGCLTDSTTPASTDGVEWVFGEDSRLSVTSGTLELCPKPSASSQEISIYGLESSSTPVSLTKSGTSVSTPGGDSGFSNAANAEAIDGSAATYTITGSSNTGGVTISGFDFSAVPPGATINSVQARVKYSADPGGVGSLKLTVQSGSGPTATVGSAGGNCNVNSSTLCVNSNSNTSGGLDQTFTLSGLNTTSALSGMTTTFEAIPKNGNPSGAATLDGITLRVSYTPTAYRAQSGCVTAVPYSSGCYFIYADGSNTQLAIHGTVYAWNGAVWVNLPNQISVAFQRGAYARAFNVTVPASGPPQAVVSIPHSINNPTTADRDVILTALLGGRTVLRVQVKFDHVTQMPTLQHWSMIGG